MQWTGCVLGLALVLVGCAPQDLTVARSASLVTSTERVAALRSRLAARPDDPDVLKALGAENLRQGQWQAAAGAYHEALLVAPADRDATLGYGRALLGGGRYGAARAHGEAALAARRDREALILTGAALAAEGRAAEGAAHLAAARAAAPRDLAARTNLALALALAGDPSAYDVMREVAFAPDADPRHRRNLVVVGGMLGLDARARSDAAALGIRGRELAGILEIGRRARSEGARAFGVATAI